MLHGYYDQYQYLPIAVAYAENDIALLVGLRYGTCEVSLVVKNDLQYLVA